MIPTQLNTIELLTKQNDIHQEPNNSSRHFTKQLTLKDLETELSETPSLSNATFSEGCFIPKEVLQFCKNNSITVTRVSAPTFYLRLSEKYKNIQQRFLSDPIALARLHELEREGFSEATIALNYLRLLTGSQAVSTTRAALLAGRTKQGNNNISPFILGIAIALLPNLAESLDILPENSLKLVRRINAFYSTKLTQQKRYQSVIDWIKEFSSKCYPSVLLKHSEESIQHHTKALLSLKKFGGGELERVREMYVLYYRDFKSFRDIKKQLGNVESHETIRKYILKLKNSLNAAEKTSLSTE